MRSINSNEEEEEEEPNPFEERIRETVKDEVLHVLINALTKATKEIEEHPSGGGREYIKREPISLLYHLQSILQEELDEK